MTSIAQLLGRNKRCARAAGSLNGSAEQAKVRATAFKLGGSLAAGPLLAAVLLGAPSPASSAGGASRALPVYGLPSEAGYLRERASTRASTILTVPGIDCSGLAPGSAAGQSYGITFSGNIRTRRDSVPHPWMAVVVRTVCEGRRAHYQPYFISAGVSSAGATEVYSPAHLAVSPGQRLALRAAATSASSTLSIEDLHTHRRDVAKGAGIADAGTSIRVSTVTANARGGVLERGTLRRSAKLATVPGPVAAAPALFARTQINGKPLLKTHGLAVELWVSRRSAGSKPRILALPIATHRPRGGFAIVITAAR